MALQDEMGQIVKLLPRSRRQQVCTLSRQAHCRPCTHVETKHLAGCSAHLSATPSPI